MEFSYGLLLFALFEHSFQRKSLFEFQHQIFDERLPPILSKYSEELKSNIYKMLEKNLSSCIALQDSFNSVQNLIRVSSFLSTFAKPVSTILQSYVVKLHPLPKKLIMITFRRILLLINMEIHVKLVSFKVIQLNLFG
jgi:hypothetical protein